jgi:hypothetical protein
MCPSLCIDSGNFPLILTLCYNCYLDKMRMTLDDQMFFPGLKALPNLGRLSFTDAIMQMVILHDDLRNLQKPN